MFPLSKVFGQTKFQRWLIILLFIQSVIVIALEAVTYVAINSGDYWALRQGSRGLPVYLILFILAQLFSIILVFDALISQNTIQLIGFVIFNLCCFIYAILQISQIRIALGIYQDSLIEEADPDQNIVLGIFRQLQAYVIVIAVVIALCQAIYTWMAFKLYKEFGWKVYKKIGADLQKKNMYRSYHIFLMFLKLDFFFFLGFAIQLMMLVLKDSDVEKGLTIAAIPIILFILFGAVYAVRHEHRGMMLAFMGGLALAIAYFVFKTTRIYTDPLFGQRQSKYFGVAVYLTVFALLSLTMTVATLVYSIICYLNFDKGLKPFHLAQARGRAGTDDIPGRARLVLDEDDAPEMSRVGSPPPGYNAYSVEESSVQTLAADAIKKPYTPGRPLPPVPMKRTGASPPQPTFDPSNPTGVAGDFFPPSQPVYDTAVLDPEREKAEREQELKRYWPNQQQPQQPHPPRSQTNAAAPSSVGGWVKPAEGAVHF